MTTYAIGDIQGCYDALISLLKKINFSSDKDILWFTGDLVNRGPDSLKVIQYVQSLKENAVTVLGNHDLHMLAILTGIEQQRPKDTLDAIIKSSKKNQIIDWIRQQPLIHTEKKSPFVLVHAGVYPEWDIPTAKALASEVENKLKSENYLKFLKNMYGNKPAVWSEELKSFDRLRFITNCFTRMRYLNDDLELNLKYKGAPKNTPEHLKPWFKFGAKNRKKHKIIFGHWSTLGFQNEDSVYSLDTGCLWGGKLTALALTKEPHTISLECPQSLAPS